MLLRKPLGWDFASNSFPAWGDSLSLQQSQFGLFDESKSCSVVSDTLQLHRFYSPWNSPGQNTGVGSCSLLQGIFPTPGIKPGSSVLQADSLYCVSHQGSPGKTIALTIWTFVDKVMSLLFNMPSRFIIAFLPKSRHLLISWLQSPQ